MMETFHGDLDIHSFDNDEEELEYLTSLMSDDDNCEVEVSLRCNIKDDKPKSRTESGAFDEELETVAKSRKRRLSHETQAHKKRRKEQSQQENDNKTALLEAELKAMKKKMLKMEQLLEEKSGSQRNTASKVTVEEPACTPLKTHVNGTRIAHQARNKNAPGTASKRTGKELLNNGNATYHRKQQQNNNAKTILANEIATEKECSTEAYSGLRIRNPLVSSQTMKERMANRKMIRIPVVCSHVKDGDIAGDWVTIGVVVSKLPPKDTAKGGRFCMLRISDLSSQSAVLPLFLFSDACKVHWKLQPGEVVAILNANLRPDDRAGPGKYTLSISNPDKLMRLGISHDFTQCKGTVKATGKRCTNFAKRSEGSCCEYHISQEYRSKMASRMEFQSGYGPTVNGINKLKQKIANGVFYGGDFVQAPKQPETATKKKKVNRLFTPGAAKTAAEVNQELKTKQKASSQSAEESAVFKEMLQLQSAGARNFNQFRNKEKPVSLDKKKAQVLSAAEVIQEQGGSGNIVSSPPIAPCLGRGSLPGADIDLSTTKKATSSIAKLKAIALVTSNPIKREDPNAIPGQSTSDKRKELIAERIKECGKEKKEIASTSSSKGGNKRSWDEIEQVMNKKSSHDWEAKEEEWAKENFYFQQMEQKEAMEEKMQKIEKLSVKVVTCKECGYTAEHASERCRKDGHHLTHKRAEKRFFICTSCNTHTISYDRYPSKPCKKCNSSSFKKSGMFKERAGPKLDSEKLLLRGKEEKFLNSLR